jgi:hypothetical protein
LHIQQITVTGRVELQATISYLAPAPLIPIAACLLKDAISKPEIPTRIVAPDPKAKRRVINCAAYNETYGSVAI